jgi:hypothetical protein
MTVTEASPPFHSRCFQQGGRAHLLHVYIINHNNYRMVLPRAALPYHIKVVLPRTINRYRAISFLKHTIFEAL